ncbi:hypothetical protein [Achromobacter sp. MFA1 R4]|uniref:hypothetical protein n=1 Tax=Achromobacter sp. MFA1 R4 TaxID=1881016 RepID=UPI0012EC5E7A|nr:hypothetical protein [Achromobacter sp. MFA1 R4]
MGGSAPHENTTDPANSLAKETFASNALPSPDVTLGDLGRATPLKVEMVPAESFFEKQVVAILALIASLIGFWFTWFMTSRTRKQSIHDEFWMRQVTYPRIVEPIIQYMAEVVQQLPGEATLEEPSTEADSFGQEFAAKVEGLRSSLVLLKATMSEHVAQQVYDTMEAALEDIEDAVTSYCSLHSDPISVAPPPLTHTSTLQAIQVGMGKLVGSLRDFQQRA